MATYTLKWVTEGIAPSYVTSKTFTAEGYIELDLAIATATTDGVVALAIDVSQIVALEIVSDQAVTLETNADDATGGDTLVLVANLPYRWCTGFYDTCKLTENVAVLYVTNTSGATANIKIRCLYDPTV